MLERAAEGTLDPELARLLSRIELRLPPLAERRAELPHWANAFLARHAALEQQEAPTLDDAALGLIFRQPWPDNLRDLEHAAYQLVLLGRSRLGADEVRWALRASGLESSSGCPRARRRGLDLLSALAATRTAGGRVNKTRAASYLGWDPDTLSARMREAELEVGSLPDPDPWSTPPTVQRRDRVDAGS